MTKFEVVLSYPKGSMFYDPETLNMVPAPAILGEVPSLSSEEHEVLAAIIGDYPTPFTGEFVPVAFFRVLDQEYSPNPMTVFVGIAEGDARSEEDIDKEVSGIGRFLSRKSKILAKGNASAAEVVFETLRVEKGA